MGHTVLFRRQEGQGQVFGGGWSAAGGFFEGGVPAVKGVFGLFAVENLLDGEDLQLGVGGAVGGFVKSGLGGLLEHGFGWGFETEEDADLSFLAGEYPDEIADLGNGDAARLYRENDLLRLAGVVVVEVEAAVDASVCALLDSFRWPRPTQSKRPRLELIFVVLFG